MRTKWGITSTYEISTVPISAIVCECIELDEVEAALIRRSDTIGDEISRLEEERDRLYREHSHLFRVVGEGSNMVVAGDDVIRVVRNSRAKTAYDQAVSRGIITS